MPISRRSLIGSSVAAALLDSVEHANRAGRRRFHACLSPEALDHDPDLLDVVARAGVSSVWIAGFFYGFWPYPIEKIRHWRDRVEARGMAASVVNIPLGHPGDSLGSSDAGFPLTPDRRWRVAVRPDGSTYVGTSLHPPATDDNVAALKRLRADGVRRVFLDDDFRLATGPGVIGGCFCDDHRRAFLASGGYAEGRWTELLNDVRSRSLSPILRAWVEFTCDQLTASFRAQEKAIGGRGRLGNMVMYLGAEKAGIRLADYAGVPLRVGELMFDDASFGRVKGKTDELFSALFHRRFVRPELAYSETTAYPADRLSSSNMAAKLAVSTIADVRNTMFMSGLTAFPKPHWDTLAPAMKENARIHEVIAGHVPRGPLKLLWGEASRYVGDDVPFSLPLALGIPFEVTAHPARDGWTFLSDADAQAASSGALRSAGTSFMARTGRNGTVRQISESMDGLIQWKRSILPELSRVPYLADDGHAVLAWYPTARACIVWNLEERKRDRVLAFGASRRTITVGPLGIVLVAEPQAS